ncbi:MAG: hypothetical protein ACREDR_03405 [Blastocatellia bacterium]
MRNRILLVSALLLVFVLPAMNSIGLSNDRLASLGFLAFADCTCLDGHASSSNGECQCVEAKPATPPANGLHQPIVVPSSDRPVPSKLWGTGLTVLTRAFLIWVRLL